MIFSDYYTNSTRTLYLTIYHGQEGRTSRHEPTPRNMRCWCCQESSARAAAGSDERVGSTSSCCRSRTNPSPPPPAPPHSPPRHRHRQRAGFRLRSGEWCSGTRVLLAARFSAATASTSSTWRQELVRIRVRVLLSRTESPSELRTGQTGRRRWRRSRRSSSR